MAVWSEVDRASVSDANRLDPEFFRIDYLLALEKLQKLGCKKLRSFGVGVVSGPFGSTLKSHSYLAEGIPFIRILDLKNFFVSNEQLIYISEEDNNKIRGSQLKTGDLVISKVGNSIGLVSILDEDYPIANISENNIGIKFGPAHNEGFKFFILTYLNSFFGQNEILRRRSGNAQPKLNVADIYNISVPEISPAFQEDIKNIVTDAKLKIKLSKELYLKASKTLEKELGLDQLVLEKPKSYETSFSEVVSGGRIDSDHFQYRYQQLKELVKKYIGGYLPLLSIVSSISPNIDPSKSPLESYSYVELSNINSSLGIIERAKTILGKDAPSRAKRYVSTGDIIASAVIGSVDKAGIVDEQSDGSLASTGFFHFRSKGVEPEYLLILIRSLIVREQLLQEATGGILSAVPDSKLRNLIVPNIPIELQTEIASLVKQSHEAKNESEQLLDQAKKMVEELIEGAI